MARSRWRARRGSLERTSLARAPRLHLLCCLVTDAAKPGERPRDPAPPSPAHCDHDAPTLGPRTDRAVPTLRPVFSLDEPLQQSASAADARGCGAHRALRSSRACDSAPLNSAPRATSSSIGALRLQRSCFSVAALSTLDECGFRGISLICQRDHGRHSAPHRPVAAQLDDDKREASERRRGVNNRSEHSGQRRDHSTNTHDPCTSLSQQTRPCSPPRAPPPRHPAPAAACISSPRSCRTHDTASCRCRQEHSQRNSQPEVSTERASIVLWSSVLS